MDAREPSQVTRVRKGELTLLSGTIVYLFSRRTEVHIEKPSDATFRHNEAVNIEGISTTLVKLL